MKHFLIKGIFHSGKQMTEKARPNHMYITPLIHTAKKQSN